MAYIDCVDCAYFWQEENEDRPYCHWQSRGPGDMAPCDPDNNDYEDNYEDDFDEEAYAEFYS